MDWMRNRALQVTLSAIFIYWATAFILGSELTRNVVDILVIVMSIILLFRLLPHAVDRYSRGGGQKNWQVLMSITLLFASFVALAAWGFAVRHYDRPAWMIESPVNGFLRFWMFAAALVLFSATSNLPETKAQPTLYYMVVALTCGILIGAGALKLISGA